MVDQRGAGVSGAAVSVPEAGQLSAVSGADGRFSLAGLAPGQYNVRISKEGYLAAAYGVSVASQRVSELQALVLDTSGYLHNDSRRVPNLCADCHVLHSPTPANHLTTDGSPNGPCARCHSGFSWQVYDPSPHGRGWTPDNPTPVRLAWEGQPDSDRGYCATCHEPHGITGPPKMLRLGQANRNDLCEKCHATASTTALHTAGWPGMNRTAGTGYYAPADRHANPSASPTALTTYPGTSYRTGECVNCHQVHGTYYAAYLTVDPASGGNYPRMTRDYGYTLCVTCHTTKQGTVTANSGHGKCTMCHDPHRVEPGKVKNPADPNGALITAAKETYRGQSMLSNSYCLSCHTTSPPAGYSTAKDPYTQSQFTNVETPTKPDTSLHRVHVVKVRPDQPGIPPFGSRSYDHPEYPYRGDVNNVRCVMCHSVHPTYPTAFDLRTDAITSRTKTGSGYNGKAGCGVGTGCHACSYCHGADGVATQNGPGGPGVDCRCYHSAGTHGIVY